MEEIALQLVSLYSCYISYVVKGQKVSAIVLYNIFEI